MSKAFTMEATSFFWGEDFDIAYNALLTSLRESVERSQIFAGCELPNNDLELLTFTVLNLEAQDILDLVDELPVELDADALLVDLWLENHPQEVSQLDLLFDLESAWSYLSAFFWKILC